MPQKPLAPIRQAVWITDPKALLSIDLNDADSIDHYTSLTDESIAMQTQGWRRIGTATITYTIDKTPQQLAEDGIDALQQAAQKLEADTQVKLNALRAEISKLQTIAWNGELAKEIADWQDVIQREGWQCIKTGCALVVENIVGYDMPPVYWGDLFLHPVSGLYLFNSATANPSDSLGVEDTAFCITADCTDDSFDMSYAGHARLCVFHAPPDALSDCLVAYLQGGA